RLPLFPLHSVLFPEATLALQIFEPRYREMIGRCLAHDEPFGVVLILEGEEVGGPAVPARSGRRPRSSRRSDPRMDGMTSWWRGVGDSEFSASTDPGLTCEPTWSSSKIPSARMRTPSRRPSLVSSKASSKRSRPAAMLSLTRDGTSWTRDPFRTV